MIFKIYFQDNFCLSQRDYMSRFEIVGKINIRPCMFWQRLEFQFLVRGVPEVCNKEEKNVSVNLLFGLNQK